MRVSWIKYEKDKESFKMPGKAEELDVSALDGIFDAIMA